MIGGNPKDGWIHKTRNAVYVDTIATKQSLNPVPYLNMWMNLVKIMFDRIAQSGCQPINNAPQNKLITGRESDTDFRAAYV